MRAVLMDRLYEPGADDLVYHYCSATTFKAILESGNIRFSDINMLTDASEVRWSYTVFEEAATRLLERKDMSPSVPTIDLAFIETIDEIVSPIQLIAHPFVACFSQESDILGQWRAYADDGRGFALGFKARALKAQLPALFLQAVYDREQQVKEMMQAIDAIFMRQRDRGEAEKTEFFEDCVLLATSMVAFKHPAFHDEREVRAVHVLNVRPQGKLFKFADPGGTIGGNVEVAGNPVTFQVRDNHLVAYTDARFWSPDLESPLVEVILGPKNHSAPGNISLFLGGLGFSDIVLGRSNVPYR